MSATEIILNICHRLVERRTAGAVPIYHLLKFPTPNKEGGK